MAVDEGRDLLADEHGRSADHFRECAGEHRREHEVVLGDRDRIEPVTTRDLYFVSRNDGSHEFSETLAAHNRAVNRFQRRRASS